MFGVFKWTGSLMTSVIPVCLLFVLGLHLSKRLSSSVSNCFCVCLCEKELGKLSDKSVLGAVGSSPVVTPRRPPEELKSNILKAQAEAAAHKVNI